MKIVVADTGALISLGLINKIDLIEKVFGDFYIANAVWEKLKKYDIPEFDLKIISQLEKYIVRINSRNHLSMIMDYGESESVILYKELNADYLLIDDNKARMIAESFSVNCIGSIGLLVQAKREGYVIRPFFKKWINNERYFSIKLLNQILEELGEESIIKQS